MKTAIAETYFKVRVDCPHCDRDLDIKTNPEVSDALDGELYADDCDIQIKCTECGEWFKVEKIDY